MAPSADATDGQDGLIAGDRPAWLAPGMRGAGKMLGEHRRRPGQVWGTGVEGCGSRVGAGVLALAEGAGAGEGLLSRRTPGMLRQAAGAQYLSGASAPALCCRKSRLLLARPPRAPRPRGFVYGLALFSEALAALARIARLHNLAPVET